MDMVELYQQNYTSIKDVSLLYQEEFLIPTMVMYALFSVIGTAGNILLIGVIICYKHLHTLTNVFVTQLAIGDLIILMFCMPFTVTTTYFFKAWVYGQYICYIVKFAGCAGPTISVLTLTVMSYERFMVILHPFNAKSLWNRSRITLICVVIYSIAILRCVIRPIFGVIYEKKSNLTISNEFVCSDEIGSHFTTWYHVIGLIIFYILPIILIGGFQYKISQRMHTKKYHMLLKNNPCTMARRRNVIRMLLARVFCFILCWGLIYSVTIIFAFPDVIRECSRKNWFIVYVFVARLLEYLSCVINPIIYTYMSTNFQVVLGSIFGRCLPCLSRVGTSTYSEVYTPRTPTIKEVRFNRNSVSSIMSHRI